MNTQAREDEKMAIVLTRILEISSFEKNCIRKSARFPNQRLGVKMEKKLTSECSYTDVLVT